MSVASDFPAKGADRHAPIEDVTRPSLNVAALSDQQPFPGLRPFAFADRAYFFGRERQIAALRGLLEDKSFVAVVGSSGSGKSSLVLAGLLGLLSDEAAYPKGRDWVCVHMRPGASPLSRLAGALGRLAVGDSPQEAAKRCDRIEWRLRQSSFSFESGLTEAGGLGGRSLLLMIDQFEELFRYGLAGLGLRRVGFEETRAREEATQFVQILLDVANRRAKDVRVLITMRSDFIGDCAYFYGLSDAVSAGQYLVPNLTRSEREDTILKPIEKARASIEPELVERLINDCSVERDWLPVLEHCLMRLWDRAGARSAGATRRIARGDYDAIGRMAESLSRHADEVLAQCAGSELAVEQAFRALSELDREGRAIRRALRFDKLLAETGAEESDLRRIIDSFRAPNCSFLVPPPSISPTIEGVDHVDIGHEALLGRWRRLAGNREGPDPKTGRPLLGWLTEEETDGQRYRTLLSLLEASAAGETASLNDPDSTKAWWQSLPRTPAWAARYGGRFDEVRKLIDDSFEDKRRAKRRSRLNRVLAGVAVVACVVIGAGIAVKMRNDEAQRQAEALDVDEMGSATKLLQLVRDAHAATATAEKLTTVSEQFLKDVRGRHKTSAADAQWVEALEIETDLQSNSGDYDKALALASEAENVTLPLAEAQPGAPEPLYLLYRVTIRVGDAFSASKIAKFDDALREYNSALGIAQKIISMKDTETAESYLIDSHAKMGDGYRNRGLEARALEEYSATLNACQAALSKFPQSFSLTRNEGAAYHRMAESMRAQNLVDGARDAYQKALGIQEALVQQRGQDLTLKSNLAATYADWGALERDHGDLNVALSKFETGVALREEGLRTQPSNLEWEYFLARNYAALADILERLNQPKQALAYYQKAFDVRRNLAIRSLGNSDLAEQLFDAAKILGDRSEGLDQILAYRTATRTLQRLLDDPKSAGTAVKHFDDAIGFARAFDDAGDWPDAKNAYDIAQMIALRNFDQDSSATFWKDKADEAAMRAAAATRRLVSPAPATPTPTTPTLATPTAATPQ
jgi:tetratricopeptide (TPR) repeat protein/energy-coupling factor transporter ATP-binding protein EcfA2